MRWEMLDRFKRKHPRLYNLFEFSAMVITFCTLLYFILEASSK